MAQGLILVVDDEQQIGRILKKALERAGHEVEYAERPEQGLQLLKDRPFDVIVTDLNMPEMNGIEFLTRARVVRPTTEVLVMTGFGTVETAVEALKRGAIDYITKPFSADQDLCPIIERILESPGPETPEASKADPAEVPAEAFRENTAGEVIAESPEMKKLLAKIPRLAVSSASVLVYGESGTGKEVIANLIHQNSERSEGPFVAVNCAALPDTLLESELFGHCRGAFTGATHDRRGFFEVADGGTIFLDEVGEVSPTFQPKLLRVLESGEFHRIGDARRTCRVDVRVIAATNRDLARATEEGHFRKDLYYRLNVVPMLLPPLRDRREDIAALLSHFVSQRDSTRTFSADAYDALIRYDWPGNVRELINAVEHAFVLGENEEISLEDLPSAVQDFELAEINESKPDSTDTLEDIEVTCILQAMSRTGHNRTQAARLLGISRRTLGYRIEKYGLAEQLKARQAAAD
jgi:DNA-binding NtrC family response regulator